MTRDSASGNGYDIWVINKDGIKEKIEEEILPKVQ
jgi:20S proteasome alpha/beta subunit